MEQIRVDISRLIITSPIAGKVLQVNIRAGEYAAAGPSQTLMLIGSDAPFHVRADVDEKDAWRVRPDARAVCKHPRKFADSSFRCGSFVSSLTWFRSAI